MPACAAAGGRRRMRGASSPRPLACCGTRPAPPCCAATRGRCQARALRGPGMLAGRQAAWGGAGAQWPVRRAEAVPLARAHLGIVPLRPRAATSCPACGPKDAGAREGPGPGPGAAGLAVMAAWRKGGSPALHLATERNWLRRRAPARGACAAQGPPCRPCRRRPARRQARSQGRAATSPAAPRPRRARAPRRAAARARARWCARSARATWAAWRAACSCCTVAPTCRSR